MNTPQKIINPKTDIFTIANLITICRLVIIFVAGNLLISNDIINSFILYLIAIVTDFLDGFIARGLKQVSNLGKILDPLADKLMTVSAIIILMMKDLMPIWYGIVIIAFSLVNIIGAAIVVKKYKYIPTSILIGKIAAVSVMMTFLINIVAFLHPDFMQILYISSTTLIIVSVGTYIYKNYNIIKIIKSK